MNLSRHDASMLALTAGVLLFGLLGASWGRRMQIVRDRRDDVRALEERVFLQKEMIAARDLYGANDVLPGLTGWAQINGRDELSIEEKARLDGEYVKKLSFAFDCKCFFGTIGKVLHRDGVVEGKQEAKKR